MDKIIVNKFISEIPNIIDNSIFEYESVEKLIKFAKQNGVTLEESNATELIHGFLSSNKYYGTIGYPFVPLGPTYDSLDFEKFINYALKNNLLANLSFADIKNILIHTFENVYLTKNVLYQWFNEEYAGIINVDWSFVDYLWKEYEPFVKSIYKDMTNKNTIISFNTEMLEKSLSEGGVNNEQYENDSDIIRTFEAGEEVGNAFIDSDNVIKAVTKPLLKTLIQEVLTRHRQYFDDMASFESLAYFNPNFVNKIINVFISLPYDDSEFISELYDVLNQEFVRVFGEDAWNDGIQQEISDVSIDLYETILNHMELPVNIF